MTDAGASAAFIVDRAGRLVHCLADGLGLFAGCEPGTALRDQLAADSAPKADALLAAVERDGAAYDWELVVEHQGAPRLVQVSGARRDDEILLVAGSTRADLLALYESMMRVSNEQANRHRAALKELARRAEAPARTDAAAFDELTRVNNELAALQRDLARANAQLGRLNQQKDAVLGMVAHDLRNPLGVIGSYAKLILAGMAGAVTDKQREFLTSIERQSHFMQSMIEDLLDLTAIESGKVALNREPFDLAVLVRDTVGLAELTAEHKGVAVTTDAPGPLPVDADRNKLQQVVTNLLTNAIKFSQPGTTTAVRAWRAGPWLRVAVADAGQGIPAAELDQLFQPFGRTSVQSTGGEKSTGLGLAIARRIVEAHGGTISVTSVEGEGSTFTLALPHRRTTAGDTVSGGD